MDALLRQALERAEEVARALADPATARDPGKLQSLGREHSRLVPIQRTAERLARLRDELGQAREVAADTIDPEMADYTAKLTGFPGAGWLSFQPLWQEICRTDPDLFD